jgi:hypothetical protein
MRRYFAPLQRHVRLRHRLGVEAAEEVVQDFMVRKVLALRLVARADRGRGRFRTFLLTALDHFTLNAARARRVRQGVPLARIAEPMTSVVPRDQAWYEVSWAQRAIHDALRLMARQCVRARRADIWGVFYARLVAPMLYDCQPLPYDQLVKRFELDSPAKASNLLITAKRAFVRALRTVVRRQQTGLSLVQDPLGELRCLLRTHGSGRSRANAVRAGQAKWRSPRP